MIYASLLRYKGIGQAYTWLKAHFILMWTMKWILRIGLVHVQLEEQDIPLVNHVNINMQSQKI